MVAWLATIDCMRSSISVGLPWLEVALAVDDDVSPRGPSLIWRRASSRVGGSERCWSDEDVTDEGIRRFLVVTLAFDWKEGGFGVAMDTVRLTVDKGPSLRVAVE